MVTGTVTFEGGPDADSRAPLAFEIQDFAFGVETPITIGSATGGAGAGKVEFGEFSIQKRTDVASPRFFTSCVAGTHYSRVTVEVRSELTALRYELEDVVIASYKSGMLDGRAVRLNEAEERERGDVRRSQREARAVVR